MLHNLNIPINLRQKINNELEPGEIIQWVEQPVPRFFTAASIASVVFSIPWTSFALFWIWGALGFEIPDLSQGLQPQHLFAMFGIPFVAVGVVMLLSPVGVWQAARKTVYLVTDKRAICIQGGWSTTIRSYFPDQLKDIYRKERADGTGDVVMSIRRWQDSDGDRRSEELGFLGVRDPRNVEKILRQLIWDHG